MFNLRGFSPIYGTRHFLRFSKIDFVFNFEVFFLLIIFVFKCFKTNFEFLQINLKLSSR